ncbi:FAD-linked oxidase C-terminal domain-containing protein [Alkalibacillus almallahensis]|uniref:FAD-linked oxidase C-terminal domain-containing protein n=1 Tax=Alkalibacillus almallahensis TaxID=1379154 RepID=UPI0014211B59|nr:FAD-linked oxidase C-terminal domain-containing protein [Alkalibacillus almallahensis]NIK12453.1 glycolate oxidase [Alkalibacillus almallahensis]
MTMTWIQEIRHIVGDEHVQTKQSSLLSYAYDATPNFNTKPEAVVAPASEQEIKEIVTVCANHQIPIVPRGSGTNLAAGTTPTQGGVVLLFHRMYRILELDEDNLTITVQPGVITGDICEAVEAKGLFYPPDPSSMKISTIGGNINENSGGLRGLKYGVTKDYVLGVNAVIANGDVIRAGGKNVKDVAGYDLTSLFVGSEGTLGIITKATLKLVPLPESKQTLLASFDSIERAAETVSQVIANKLTPATLEFIDRATIQAVEDYTHVGLPTDAEAVLLIEQDGPPSICEHDIQLIQGIAIEHGAITTQIAETEERAAELREARRSALSALAKRSPTTILEDATVPRSEIATMVKAIEAIALEHDVNIATFGHAGDGNLHPTCMTDLRDKDEWERVEAAFAAIFRKAIDLGGTITGEHGVGEMKSPYLAWKVGDEGIQLMNQIKLAFDPEHIMNPGKIFHRSGGEVDE